MKVGNHQSDDKTYYIIIYKNNRIEIYQTSFRLIKNRQVKPL